MVPLVHAILIEAKILHFGQNVAYLEGRLKSNKYGNSKWTIRTYRVYKLRTDIPEMV